MWCANIGDLYECNDREVISSCCFSRDNLFRVFFGSVFLPGQVNVNASRMPNLDYYNTARMHQMVNSFQDIFEWFFLSLSRISLVVILITTIIIKPVTILISNRRDSNEEV